MAGTGLNNRGSAVRPGEELDWQALDEALKKLEAQDPRKGQIVVLKFFGGLTMDEIARELEVSKSSIERDWRYIRAWLYKELDSN